MNTLLKALINTVKTKIISLWSKLRYWFNINFWQSAFMTWVRTALNKIFDIKPRHKNDYFATRNWLISRRLAFAVVLAIGILSLYLIVVVINPAGYLQNKDGVRTYRYTSLPLRFVEGDVKIKARSGYVAYSGNVSKGYATGYGELYDKEGNLVYSGDFDKSKYNGTGTLFYSNGQTQYKGQFVDNLFEGNGIQYRTNGSKLYEGEFVAGMREGNGQLFDGGSNPVFNGTFHCDSILYDQFLGKKTEDLGEMYTGASIIYTYDSEAAVLMSDINAIYVVNQNENSIEDNATIDQIYVMEDTYKQGQTSLCTIEELTEAFGTPAFEGNSYVTFPEAVAINTLNKKEEGPAVRVDLQATSIYDELKSVDSYLTTAELYLYVYQTDNVTYSFFCEERNGPFFMYSIEE